MSLMIPEPAGPPPPRAPLRLLSVVTPMYREAGNVDRFFRALEPVLERLAPDYEIVCVNDGSPDDTLARLLAHIERNPRIRVVDLSRNFGKELALSAALDHARGDAVVCIDADLQHPPDLIQVFLERWREGHDVVYAVIRSRAAESWQRRLLTRLFYWLFNRLAQLPLPPHAGDFRLLDRRVVEVLKRMPERTRFMKGLFNWVGFRQCGVAYDPPPRSDGHSSWGFARLWRFALDGIVAFSTVPLVVWSYAGFVIAILSLLYGTLLVLRTLLYGIDVPGYASLMVAVLFLGGIQLLSLGVIGEYVARIYSEVKGRPLYVVKGIYGGAAAMAGTAGGTAPHGRDGRMLVSLSEERAH
jgi:polyisoprenyl-phosphate glycosyltransferase